MSSEATARFSVVTAVRNGMPFIQGCVASVTAQGGNVLEHLVQDALSTDGTAQWCRGQGHASVVSEADAGMYDAINKGWARATGQYLSWLNADEQYLPETLQAVGEAFDSNPNADVVFGDAIIVDALGKPLAYRREPMPRALYIRNSFLYVYSCTLFYRRRLWDAGLLELDGGLRYAADMDLILRLLSHGVQFVRLPRALALYTASGANLSTHDGMREETVALRQKYGGARFHILRSLSRVPRWAERFVLGGFSERSGSYRYYSGPDGVATEVVYRGLRTRYSVFEPTRAGTTP